MATIVNNPPAQQESGNGLSMIVGVLAVLLFILFFIMYLLPMMRQSMTPPQINVPDKVDVNVNQSKK